MYVRVSCLKLQLAVGQAKVTRLSPDTPFIEIYLFNYSYFSGIKGNLALYVKSQYSFTPVSFMNGLMKSLWVTGILFRFIGVVGYDVIYFCSSVDSAWR